MKNNRIQTTSPTTHLQIEGMTCASCVGRVEHALQAVSGVTEVVVNLATERATVHGSASTDSLIRAVQNTGYQATLFHENKESGRYLDKKRARERTMLQWNLWIAAFLTLPVFLLEMGSHLFPPVQQWIQHSIGIQSSWIIQFILTTLVLIFPGRDFYLRGIPALLRLAPDMNSLVAVGTGAAYIYSVVATLMPALLPKGTVHVYFEAAAVIVVLILLGRFLEASAKGKTSAAIQRLMGLQAKTAHVSKDGHIIDIPIEKVVVNDVIEVLPGERVPVDGILLHGESFVDESMITGEPVPVQKVKGQHITGGTINQKGTFSFRATAVGEHTMLSQIIQLVEQVQGSRLPIQTIVNKITLWFVPIVMGVALLTFFIWFFFGPSPALSFALVNAVAVLIIACPCAMGLATPTSVMVGTGRGAEMGVLFRKGDALQRLKDVKMIALDKTGTLTKGHPTLTDFEVCEGFNQEQVLRLIAIAESRSEHPIATAIMEAAGGKENLPTMIDGFESITGMGIRARIGETRVEVGANRFMQTLGLDTTGFSVITQKLSEEGKTPLYAAVSGKLAAVIAVSDPVKPDTREVLTALHDSGLKIAMITGDNVRTAQAIAKQLGIDEVIAEVLPEGKIKAVQQLQKRYGALAFVGDGINDAPALVQADVGLAIGSGTDIAMESADVVLISGSLRGIPDAIALSKATIRNIRQNLFWAFAYNVALIPVAAGILYPLWGILLSPVFAAGAMALSSIFVVTNALRLKRFKPALFS